MSTDRFHRRMRFSATVIAVGLVTAAWGSADIGHAAPAISEQPTDGTSAHDTRANLGLETLEVMSRWGAGTAEAAAFEAAVASFTEQSGVEVEIIGQAEEGLDVIYETALLGGAEPHVVIVNLFDQSIAWLDEEATVDVAGYVQDWGLGDVLDADALSEWTLADGRVQGFPYSGFAWPVWYNTALLSEAGVDSVPTTIDELKAATAALRDAGIGPVVVGGNDFSGQKLFMQIAQSYLDAEQTRGLYQAGGWCGNPDAMRGLELFADLLDSGVFVDDVEGFSADLMTEAFYNGDAAIMPSGSWGFANTPDELIANIQLGGFPLPDGSVFDNPTVYQGFTGVGFMVSPRGEAEALPAIRAFVEHMYSADVYGSFVSGANLVPAILLSDPAVASNPLLQDVLAADYDDSTDLALLMDVYVPPASGDAVNQAIALAYTGADATEVCELLDAGY